MVDPIDQPGAGEIAELMASFSITGFRAASESIVRVTQRAAAGCVFHTNCLAVGNGSFRVLHGSILMLRMAQKITPLFNYTANTGISR